MKATELTFHYDKDGHDLELGEVIDLLAGMRDLTIEGAAAYGIGAAFETRVEARPGSFEIVLQLRPDDAEAVAATLIAMSLDEYAKALGRVRDFVLDALTYVKKFGGKVIPQEYIHAHEDELVIQRGDEEPTRMNHRSFDHIVKGPVIFKNAEKVIRPVGMGEAQRVQVASGATPTLVIDEAEAKQLMEDVRGNVDAEPVKTTEQKRRVRATLEVRSVGLDPKLQWHLRDPHGTDYRMPLRDEEFRRRMDAKEVVFAVGDSIDADILITEQVGADGEPVGAATRAILQVHSKLEQA